MAHCNVYSAVRLHTLALLMLSASRVLLINGQVGSCTGNGCSCASGYECCLAVREEASMALVGSATISQVFANVSLIPGHSFSVSERDASFFTINSSGDIRTSREIDRESEGNCILITVIAEVPTSGGTQQRVKLFAINIEDINDHKPEFMQQNYTFQVPETLDSRPVELTCPTYRSQLTAVDGDNGPNSQITYTIVSGSDYFTVESNSPCIQNSQELDFETNRSFTVVLEARDNGMPPLSSNVTITFNLENLNDNAPRFTAPTQGSLSLSVQENETVGYLVYHFMAVTADTVTGEFYFTIRQTQSQPQAQPSLPFEINRTTGEMTVNSALDFETTAQYDLKVEAIIGQQSSSVMVTVMIEDINEPAEIVVTPRRLSNPINIVENELVSSPIITIVVRDPDNEMSDNRNNTIRFVTGGEYFDSTQFTQFSQLVIAVEQNVSIDREVTGDRFDLVVELIEGNNPLLHRFINATIQVGDVNDNAPHLTKEVFYYTESAQNFEILTSLGDFVVDPDSGPNGTVSLYELISVVNQDGRNLTDRFIGVNRESGRNLLSSGQLRAPALDRERDGPSLNITMKFTDDGDPQMSAIVTFLVEILDVNDNPPQFTNMTYIFSLLENTMNSSVGRVFASDPDNGENGTVIYTIIGGSNFTIDPQSGEIKNAIVFDREAQENYTITVCAHDNGSDVQLNATAVVIVMIGDENDNPPVFTTDPLITTLSVSSDAAVGTSIGRVEATDRDIEANAIVRYQMNPSVLFSINSSTGDVIVAEDLSGHEGTLTVNVTAYNPGPIGLEESFLTINITITAPERNIVALAIGVSSGVLLLLIAIVLCVIICLHYKSRRGKHFIATGDGTLNNQPLSKPQRSILRHIPVTNGTKAPRVTFHSSVQRTTYNLEDETVHTVESITRFDESPQTGRPHRNGTIPLEEVNGNIPLYQPLQRSPLAAHKEQIVRAEMEASQSSTIDEAEPYNCYDGNSDEESTLADDASNMNTLIPCFRSPDDPAILGSPMHYALPPQHSHPHAQHTPSPAHVLASLPPHTAQYPMQHTGSLSDNLTPLASNPQHSHESISPTPTSPQLPSYIAMPTGHHILHPNPQNYPLVMPDALPEVQRYQMEPYVSSFSDYDTSIATYASSELDEALEFKPDIDHGGVYTLSATEYDDEDTQL